MSPSKARVLLVEDEGLIAMMTEDMLADLGYEVAVTALNLESGLQAAAEEDFDIGLLDINLKGKQSYPIAEILDERGIPFAFVSGNIGRGVDPRFARAPALQKPFSTEALAALLALMGARL